MPALRVSQRLSEVLVALDTQARVSQSVVEVLYVRGAVSPTTPTGAGVSQDVVEVLLLFSPQAGVSQYCVEVLFTMAAIGEGGAVGGGSDTKSFGYAV